MSRLIKKYFNTVVIALMVLSAVPAPAMFFSDETMLKIEKSIERAVANGMKDGVSSGISTGIGTGLSDGIANGVGGAVNNFFTNFEANMAEGANGQQAMHKLAKNIIDSIGGQFKEGKAADEATENIIGFLKKAFAANGVIGGETGEIGANMGKTFKSFADGAVPGIGEGLDAIREEVADQAHNFADIIRDEADSFTNNAVKNGFKIGAGVALSIALSVSAVYGTKVLWRHVERKLMRPKLIIDSSDKSILQRVKVFFAGKKEPVKMIFSPEVGARIQTITKATKNIHARVKEGKTNVKYRNVLLYGAPGTGKTMFAKKLAEESGLEWVLMSGSSFAKFKDGQDIEELDHLMQWAQKSNGLMIIIDECDELLRDRKTMEPGSRDLQLSNNFLNYTGERSNRFMLVMMTNHKNNIDSAMHRRIDDFIEIPLPGVSERAQVLALYRDKILKDVYQNGQPFVNSVVRALDNKKINEMAAATQGLSNGDLEGIINTIKTDADTTDSGMISTSLVDTAVKRAMEKYKAFGTQDKNSAIGYAVGAA